MRSLFAICLFLFSGLAIADQTFDHLPTQRRVAARLEAGDTINLAAESFDNMFRLAQIELIRKGYRAEARQLGAEWGGHYRLVLTGVLGDTGDHAPLSQWVQDWYQKLEDLLGVRIMELTHLRDIWVLNYTIPVVFHAEASNQWCVEQLKNYPSDTCEWEYRRHFAGTKYEGPDPFAKPVLHHGFSGVVTYWVVWGVCEAATWGTGAALACSPAGDLAEIAIEKWVAPNVSDKLYARANQ